ncbi:MAG: hypothetical protein CALGDGBN_02756 [Pseudomonadales bacterium]|nr:hypothetical protein [Pseudomonadales bacterium]
MQADILVQSPYDTQSYNRYSYLMNNPLNGTDPSGYRWFDLKDAVRIGVAVGLSYLTGGAASGWAAGWFTTSTTTSAIVAGAVGGAAGGFVGGAIMSGSMEGALQGAFSGAVLGGIGAGFASRGLEGSFGHVGTSALAGGGISVMQGGKFRHGFLSAGISAAAMPSIRNSIETAPGRVFASALVGGTVSELSGGKFANGAMTAAFQAAAGEVAFSNDGLAEGSGSDDESLSTEMPDWAGDPDVVSAQGSIWSGSRTDLPPNQRMEQGGWVVHRWFAADGDYDVIRVPPGSPHTNPWMGVKPSPLTCFCTVKGSIHSHPLRYSDGPWDPYRPSSADLSHSKQFRIPGVVVTFPRPTDNIYQVIPYKGW